jgi:signal transduction histidine kinase
LRRVWRYIRDLFARPFGKETVRAFAVFSLLLVALLAVGGELALRELSLTVLRDRLDLGRREAEAIAAELEALRPEWILFDDAWLAENRDLIQRLVRARIVSAEHVHHVEIRDSMGRRLARVPGRMVRRQANAARLRLPVQWPLQDQEVIRVPLRDDESRLLGEVRLAVSQDALQDELEDLRHSLWIRIAIAGAVALLLLVIGLIYLLRLLKKNRELERARQSAARASYVGLLASGLAHEIRNPLNAMNMNIQMLEEEMSSGPGSADGEHGELLESTKSEIKRLERLVNNFLAYARPARPHFETTDPNLVVREVLRLLEADFRQSAVELRQDLEPLLPHAETDVTQIKQALINLLVNARQVLKEGGTVTVRTRAGAQGEVVIEVEDDGPGIPDEIRERIFEVFYSSRGGGTGLGLPIAKQIVERHGGRIEVASVEGQGTTFRVRLPRIHPEAAEVARAGDERP